MEPVQYFAVVFAPCGMVNSCQCVANGVGCRLVAIGPAALLSNTMIFDEVTLYLCAILCVLCIMYVIPRLLAEPAVRMAPLCPVVASSTVDMAENHMLLWS